MKEEHWQVEEDGDEVFTPMPTHCTLWGCISAFHGRRLPPAPLFRNDRGFMECSRCGCSYGKG